MALSSVPPIMTSTEWHHMVSSRDTVYEHKSGQFPWWLTYPGPALPGLPEGGKGVGGARISLLA